LPRSSTPLWRRAAGRALRVAPHFRPTLLRAELDAWRRDAAGGRRYHTLSADEVRATRRSDTVFVFGSGYSIREIAPDEWAHFAAHDTLSFNWFVHQRWARMDYHLIREVATNDLQPDVWKPALHEYAELLRTNPHYSDTIFVVQRGLRAINGNRIVGLGLLPSGARLFRFTNRARHHYEPPSESFARGLVHSATSVGTCVNFAYLMGWRSIVLVGVDLYDHRYFWLEPEEERREIDLPRRGLAVGDPFPAAPRIVTVLGTWRKLLAASGVTLSVYNPRSLLAAELPVYERR
jgi:hypothetical protein